MRRLLAALLLALALAAPAAAATPRVEVAVTRDGDRWTADFAFSQRVPVLFFPRSALTRVGQKPWRPDSWRVVTPGVRLSRQGHYDLLSTLDGRPLPRIVRIAFTPAAVDLLADYDPALVFTDGSVALYTMMFNGVAATSAADVARLPIDITGVPLVATDTSFSFADRNGQVLVDGRRSARARLVNRDDDGTYVLFGTLAPTTGPAFVSIFDPQLPQWLRSSLEAFTPRLLNHYAAQLGPSPGPKPTIMASWAGPTAGMASMGGSVLSGLITMAFEGVGVVRPNSQIRDSANWFMAHESAHFWLGQAVRYEFSRDSWIMEGGADLLAIRAVGRLDPGFDQRAQLQKEVDDCVTLTRGQSLASAETRNEYRAYYACGAVLSLAAEAATRKPFERFVRDLIAANRTDRIVSRGEWLDAATGRSRNPALRRAMDRLIDTGAGDSAALVATILREAGVPFTAGPNGVPKL